MMTDGVCSPLVLVIIIAREFAVSGLRMVAAGAPDGAVIAANMWGKVKTVLQMVTICFYYFGVAIESALCGSQAANSAWYAQGITYALCWLVAAVTLISGVKYLWDNRRFINTAK
jgi:CDP-diacylglycerol--glycerol-3-phosphate 3-phosphatidyltransferase